MNRYVCRIIFAAAAIACLTTNAQAVVVVAEDFFYKEVTKDITNLSGFTGQSYGGGQDGAAGVWNNRWAAIGGSTIVGDDVTTPPLNANPYTAVVTEFASAVSLQRNYVPTGAALSSPTIYFAADFKVDDVSTPSIFAEFGILSPAATLNIPRVSIGITDSGGTATPTFFGKLGTLTLGNPGVNANDAITGGPYHRIVGKLQINAGPVVGDYNSNGVVDGGDYVVWRNNVGTAFVLPNRDPANTGNVGNGDYNSWRARFGQTGAERLTVYLDPTGVEQSNATILNSALIPIIGSFGDASLALVASLNGNATPDAQRPFYIDNLAIGTTWADVASVNVPRLTLEVNTVNGQTRLINNSGQAINLAYYEILSASNALNPAAWNSLDDQNVSGGTWTENSPMAKQLIESNFTSSTTIASGGGILSLGAAFNPGGTHDLIARWGTKQGNEGLLNLANVVYVPGAGSAVPEPACSFLLIFCAAVGIAARRRAGA
jgi:hypothetical protein